MEGKGVPVPYFQFSLLATLGRPEGREGRRCGGRGTECGDSVEELADKERRSLYIFSLKKVARLSASELAEVHDRRGEDDLRCIKLLVVCQRERGLLEEEDTRLELCCFRCKN